MTTPPLLFIQSTCHVYSSSSALDVGSRELYRQDLSHTPFLVSSLRSRQGETRLYLLPRYDRGPVPVKCTSVTRPCRWTWKCFYWPRLLNLIHSKCRRSNKWAHVQSIQCSSKTRTLEQWEPAERKAIRVRCVSGGKISLSTLNCVTAAPNNPGSRRSRWVQRASSVMMSNVWFQ